MQPGQAPPGSQPPQPSIPHQHPQPINRGPNGVPSRPSMMAFSSSMPNGVVPPPGPMQGPTGYMSQPNGIPQPGPPLPQGISAGQGQSFQQMAGGPRSLSGMPNQQPPPQQPPQQQRGPSSNAPFQSPNMASPQNPAGPPQHPQHTQPLMGQLGPSPHPPNSNRGVMLPQNQGMNPMNSQGPPVGAGAAPPMQYPQMGRPLSRAATPGQGQGGMMHPSPSMANRQPPGGMSTSVESTNTQFMLLSQGTVGQVCRLLGIELRDIASLSMQDKVCESCFASSVLCLIRVKSRILDYCRSKSMQPQPGHPGGGPPDNAAAGPSNPMMMQTQVQRNINPQQRNPQQPLQRGKRNSTSPGEEVQSINVNIL